MGGFFGWFVVLVVVAAIFNAEKLPALRQMLEEKMKGGVAAAKEGAKIANDKIKKVKTDIENKKNAPAVENDPEENTPEEIEESLQFMGNYIKDNNKEENNTKEQTIEEAFAVSSENTSEEEPQKKEDEPIDLEHRY